MLSIPHYMNCNYMERIVLDHNAVLNLLPERKPDSHKGDYGKILLLCGSRGYTGAAALAAMGALRCGAGLVYLGVPECIYAIEASKLLEPIVFPLPDEKGAFSEESVKEIRKSLVGKDAVLVGPGMGRGRGVQSVVALVMKEFCGPVVVDADGINILAAHMDILRGRKGPTVLTPHSGEFSRLGGNAADRENSAVDMANELGATIVLKGNQTVITDGDRVYINPTGNPGMAVGGSGDVLAGMITALIGQGLSVLDAAACGAWLHGKAGDVCAKQIGQYGMLPSDMLWVIPRLMK